jgi:hypothetical protein
MHHPVCPHQHKVALCRHTHQSSTQCGLPFSGKATAVLTSSQPNSVYCCLETSKIGLHQANFVMQGRKPASFSIFYMKTVNHVRNSTLVTQYNFLHTQPYTPTMTLTPIWTSLLTTIANYYEQYPHPWKKPSAEKPWQESRFCATQHTWQFSTTVIWKFGHALLSMVTHDTCTKTGTRIKSGLLCEVNHTDVGFCVLRSIKKHETHCTNRETWNTTPQRQT